MKRPMYINHFTNHLGEKRVVLTPKELEWLAGKAGRRVLWNERATDSFGDAVLHLKPKDLRYLAKIAGFAIHTKDKNNIITVGGPKHCHNPKCRCRKAVKP